MTAMSDLKSIEIHSMMHLSHLGNVLKQFLRIIMYRSGSSAESRVSLCVPSPRRPSSLCLGFSRISLSFARLGILGSTGRFATFFSSGIASIAATAAFVGGFFLMACWRLFVVVFFFLVTSSSLSSSESSPLDAAADLRGTFLFDTNWRPSLALQTSPKSPEQPSKQCWTRSWPLGGLILTLQNKPQIRGSFFMGLRSGAYTMMYHILDIRN